MEPTRERIAELAYQIYLSEGCPDGRESEHWAKAEAILWETELSKTRSRAKQRRAAGPQLPKPRRRTLSHHTARLAG